MDSATIRKKFLKFFEERGHAVVSSSSLVPDDPSVLLTTAGMQQFKPYYTGEGDAMRDFGSLNTVSIQKSFRTSDIDEVGDETHLTFFEMLGNFSFGYKPGEPRSPKEGYFKEEAIKLAHEFITKEMGFPISYVTIFEGSDSVPKDEESRRIWQSLGVKDIREEGIEDNFWGPTGNAGPCGPTTEIYCENSAGGKAEIWNIVFNEFFFPGSRAELLSGASGEKLEKLKTPGVDTGMGLERLAMIAQNKKNIFETDLFAPLMELLPPEVEIRHRRIIVDHLRGLTFLLADGVRPSNKEAGYILRRLMRRAFVYEKTYNISVHVFNAIIHDIVHEYGEFYAELIEGNDAIREEFKKEREIFAKASNMGLKELKKRYPGPGGELIRVKPIDAFIANQHVGKEAADLHQTFGLPVEIIREYLEGNFYKFDETEFNEEVERAYRAHQEVSRAGVEKKFGGHGLVLDTGELKAGSEEELKIVTRLHTATHLLNAALHKVLGDSVEQRGSDITAERTRFDFLFPRKLTDEEIQKIEESVNYAIEKDFPMMIEEVPLEEAKKSGALFFYKGHYPERVKVYTVGNDSDIFSKELCGGPHVTHTGEIGRFKITKEESSSAGVRRIRAVVE